MRSIFRASSFPAACLLVLALSCGRLSAADSLTWNTNQDRVSAHISSTPVLQVLEEVAHFTGWHVYVESNMTRTVSTKFQDLPTGEALRMLLGDLNFALVPQTNGPNHLYVFRTSLGNARILIRPSDLVSKVSRSGKIPNQLIVTLKPGTKIEALDCLGNAHVTGRMDSINAYRVEFKDAAAAQAAHDCLTNNPSVLSVENNYSMEPPNVPLGVANQSPQFNLTPKASSGNCQVIIGLVDTQIQPVAQNLNQFLLPGINVAPCSPASSSSQLTHGTAMLNVIAQGLAQGLGGGVQAKASGQTSVKILPVDVYGCNETTTTFDVANGIYQAINGGANMINLSLGGTGDSSFLQNLIQQGESQGVVFFAAAGNQPVTTPFYPAAYPGVQAVTASSAPGQLADYADHGNFVDLMLPGTGIVPYDGQSWAVTGTSTATAYATGIAAGIADSSHDCPQQVVPTMQSDFGVSFGGGQ